VGIGPGIDREMDESDLPEGCDLGFDDCLGDGDGELRLARASQAKTDAVPPRRNQRRR
jgi:hypothetical protein